MSALTVDQIKKALTTKGVQLPPSGTKKSEYLKLYEQHVVVNKSLGEAYSSDDDTPLNASWNVSSSCSPEKSVKGDAGVVNEVESLSDDDLYQHLLKLGLNIGPVVANTRKVYEKKLIKLLTVQVTTNGVANVHSKNESEIQNDFSDSDVEPIQSKPDAHTAPKQSSVPRGSVPRDVNKQSSVSAYSTKHNEEGIKKSVFTSLKPTDLKPARQSFIEMRRKGSSERYIEPAEDEQFEPASSSFRSSYASGRYSLGADDSPYQGTWNPKIDLKGASQPTSKQNSTTSYKAIAVVAIGVLVAVLAYFVCNQWSVNDPFKLIEDDAEREIQHHTVGQPANN